MFINLGALNFIATLLRRKKPQEELVEAQKAHIPIGDAASRVLNDGRAVHMAYGSDGRLHLRRRARQLKRDFGRGVTWMAMPKADAETHVPPTWKRPWWWL